jgi:hypothetical protein
MSPGAPLDCALAKVTHSCKKKVTPLRASSSKDSSRAGERLVAGRPSDRNRDTREVRLSSNLAAQTQSVRQWHYPVGNNEVGHVVLQAFGRLNAIARGSHPVPFVDQDEGPGGESLGLVIHEQNRIHLRPPIGQFRFSLSPDGARNVPKGVPATTASACLWCVRLWAGRKETLRSSAGLLRAQWSAQANNPRFRRGLGLKAAFSG